MHFAVAAVAPLMLSNGAQAGFVTYAGSGSDTTFVAFASDAIDLGVVSSLYQVQASLGLSVTSLGGSNVTPNSQANLQIVQGCLLAPSACGGNWFDIPALGLGTAFFAPGLTTAKQYDSGLQLETTASRSFRVLFSADYSPKAASGVSGSLSVTAIPEPGTWAMVLAGLIGFAGIARRRLGSDG